MQILKVHEDILGASIFDGSSLFVSKRLPADPLELWWVRKADQKIFKLTVTLVAQLAPTDATYIQIIKFLLKKSMEAMGLKEMGRHFLETYKSINIAVPRLELWPGFKTSILVGVHVAIQVLHLNNCLQIMRNLGDPHGDMERVKDRFLGWTVRSIHSRKAYQVVDIDWNTTPLNTFYIRGKPVTFLDYFQNKYGIMIREVSQPMLVCRRKKGDTYPATMTRRILLVPEICQMTGLTDEMRVNYMLMKSLATHLHGDPSKRLITLNEFMSQLQGIPSIQDVLHCWGLKSTKQIVNCDGHVVPKSNLDQTLGSMPMLSTVHLKTWAVIVPRGNANIVPNLVRTLKQKARSLGLNISNYAELYPIGDTRPIEYVRSIDALMNKYQHKMQLFFVILPHQDTDIYAAVKKRACMEHGVPAQCFVVKNAIVNDHRLQRNCANVVVQMNAKLGGEPWTAQIPLKNLMIIGFDAYRCAKRRSSSIGAMVATMSATHARYFSTVSEHQSGSDMSEKIGADFAKCLHAYKEVNGVLPERIIMYRDGVPDDGQPSYVCNTELRKIQQVFASEYKGLKRPKFSFILVKKHINARVLLLESNKKEKEADDDFTLPKRYDFCLVPQHSGQGALSPTSYNVLYDRQGLGPERMQKLTYMLCHNYFNGSSTLLVPAPCHCAHKLAYYTRREVGGPSHECFSRSSYYL